MDYGNMACARPVMLILQMTWTKSKLENIFIYPICGHLSWESLHRPNLFNTTQVFKTPNIFAFEQMIHSEDRDEVGVSRSPKYYRSLRTTDSYPHEKISLIDGPGIRLAEHEGPEELPYFNNPFVLYYSPNTSGFPMESEFSDLSHNSHGLSSPEAEEPGALKSVRTEKRRISRVSGFLLLAFLGFFLVVSSLLQSTSTNSSLSNHQTRDSEAFILSPQALRSSSQQQDSPEPRMKRLPQCVIIGARKCGTRALIDMLNLRPQVRQLINAFCFQRHASLRKLLLTLNFWHVSFLARTDIQGVLVY